MKLPLEWLSEFVSVSDIDAKAYCDRMTDTGSKVEGFEVLAQEITNVVVGKIVKQERHPDSDHLWICQIDAGEGELRQIITGAQNIFEGALVPVAKAPATLPGGVTIKKGKLRGLPSDGMLCSMGELGLTEHELPYGDPDGILILQEDCQIGQDIRDALRLSDTVVEFEITPNRPDCLSVIGLARETAASFDRPAKWHAPCVKETGINGDDVLKKVTVTAPDLCLRYTAKVVKNVKIQPSPDWMRMRLHAAGVRPINNIVDITNYVMLEYGQPMHAFDARCISGNEICVRRANEGEQFRSLDDIDHTLRSDMLVIADQEKAVALAGVMGGANSEITDDTTTVIFESATFMGASVRITSRALGMRTESSGRFEKGLDCENTVGALLRACELVQLLGAGDVADGMTDIYPNPKPQRVLPLECDRINRFLGVSLDESFMKETLSKLEFTVNGDTVTVPSWRDDVESMNDLAEEVIRIYGYNKIETTAFTAQVRPGSFTDKENSRRRMMQLLCGLGAYEIRTFSFISPKYYDKIALAQDDVRRRSVVIRNPLGEDTSVMRTTLIPSLLEVLAHNDNHHSNSVMMYEAGQVYLPSENEDELPQEPIRLTLGFYGDGDFYRLKGICQAVLDDMGIQNVTYAPKADDPTFHPGQCATASMADGTVLATLGALHPSVAQTYGFDRAVYVLDLDFETAFANSNYDKQYHALPKYPAVSRDLAFLCDENLPVGTVENVMKRAGGKLLEGVQVFDVYRGTQLPEGKKSVAFNISLRAQDHTLTVEEADHCTAKILKAIEKELGLQLRS